MTQKNFASDNVTGACPEVLAALAAANDGEVMPYGADPATARVEAALAELFETEVSVFPVATGTACNALAHAACVPPWGVLYCHRISHAEVHECGAPEFFTHGAKLTGLPGEGAKLSPDDLEAVLRAAGKGDVHHVQPAALTLTQATELGTVYRVEEIAALAAVARGHGLSVHMDGARFANALVALGCTPAEMTWKAGVDVLSFGGTKNGCLAAEALVFFRRDLAANSHFQRKRAGHLFSKMRFLSAQLEGYLSDEAWLRNARAANAATARLAEGLSALPGVSLAAPAESNQLFVRLPKQTIAALQAQGWGFYVMGEEIRLVTGWSTTAADADAFVAAVAASLQERTAAE